VTRLVRLQPEYLAGVAELERICFAAEPWSEAALGVLCRDHGAGFAVLDEQNRVLAYGGMTYAADEGAITNIATHPDARRQGLGRAIVQALIQEATSFGLTELYLEVRTSNTPAIALYTLLGFETIGTRKNFYRHPTEDALLMRAVLSLGTS
jgi:ribosomal-protein-alanine N-acetyltransferase